MVNVIFLGGESREDSNLSCNYMIARDGSAELYAEKLVPDEWYDMDEIPDEERERFDDASFAELKEEIIEQAMKNGIDPADLKFWEG
jgi:hypothetical protein